MNKATASAKFLVLLACAVFLFFDDALAQTFNLSYSLTEGGTNRLELDQNNQSKGVRISISSDVATRYEVDQRIIQPLESRDVPGLAIRDNFVFRGLTGTNRYGSLRIPTGDTSFRQEDTLYISDSAGSADSFTLVYGLIRAEEIKAGDYYGRIGFTLTPIGSTRQPVTQILEVHVSITREASVNPQIEISTPTGSKQIVLNPKREETKAAALIIKINGKFKKPFTIKQFLAQQPESLEGERLDYGAINFVVKDVTKGTAVNQLTALSNLPQNIYSSAADAEAENNLVVSYSLGDLSQQQAGKYRSRIQYLLDEMGVESRIDSIELDVENAPVFDLVITPQDQKYVIEFRDLKPLGPPKRNEIVIEIKTNRGKKYQVTQEVYSELRDREGGVIPSQYFTFQTQSLDTKGKLNFSDKKEVKGGNTILFISDELGSPDKFKVIYELSCSEQVRAGDYSSSVTYSLLEI